MHVVAHQGIGVDMATEPLGLLAQVAQVFRVVDFENEARSPVHSTLHDVLRNSSGIESETSGHGASMPSRAGAIRRQKPETE
jgi:hypothetical protein